MCHRACVATIIEFVEHCRDVSLPVEHLDEPSRGLDRLLQCIYRLHPTIGFFFFKGTGVQR